MFNILVVEDNRKLLDLFCAVLSDHGYRAVPAHNGEEAMDILEHQYIDLMISDIMMPKMDGYELTKQLREANFSLPILMITAKGTMNDKQRGFDAGTDDYMVKPVDVNEMLWRVAALLRRMQAAKERVLEIGQTVLNCDTLTVTCQDVSIELPQKEFYVLYKLVFSMGRIFTRQ